jgi:cyclopropane-fatty-acyl-phospholipid synthase
MTPAHGGWRPRATFSCTCPSSSSIDIAFELWDGSIVPEHLQPGGRSCGSSSAIETAPTRSDAQPRADNTHRALYQRRHRPGRRHFFDLVEKRSKVRTREMRKKLKLGRIARNAWPILRAPVSGCINSYVQDEDQAGGTGGTRVERNKRNIAHHYDVSNDFYRLFLDPEMVYSCGYFKDWGNDIATAQIDKLDMICRKLRLKPGERMLDIGCGWGALACHAAANYGVEVHGVTLSEEQFALARDRVIDRGLSDKVTIEIRDFSELQGGFDKIASIGMFEHVGLANHSTYFSTVHRLLRPRGVYLHHAIARRGKKTEKLFQKMRPEYKAMRKFIFPGGEVDHIGMTAQNLEGHGFEVHDVEAWREHYARTCKLWAERLVKSQDEAVKLRSGSETYRLWVLYLSGVSMAFQRGTLGIFQTVATRRDRGALRPAIDAGRPLRLRLSFLKR